MIASNPWRQRPRPALHTRAAAKITHPSPTDIRVSFPQSTQLAFVWQWWHSSLRHVPHNDRASAAALRLILPQSGPPLQTFRFRHSHSAASPLQDRPHIRPRTRRQAAAPLQRRPASTPLCRRNNEPPHHSAAPSARQLLQPLSFPHSVPQ